MRVGSGFIMLAYYSYCIGDHSKSSMYSSIAKRIAESEGLHFSDMHMNTLVGLGYASKDYDERMKIFQSLGNGKTLGDQVFSVCICFIILTLIVGRTSRNRVTVPNQS